MKERLLRTNDTRVAAVSRSILAEELLPARALKKENEKKCNRHNTNDGKGICEASSSPTYSNWIEGGTRLQKGASYIHAVKIRGNVASTKLRSARGRPGVDVLCNKGCGRVESLGHILQTCPILAPERTRRHDRVLDLVVETLNKKQNISMIREPNIRTDEGLRKPDLKVFNNERSSEIDVQISSDSANMNLETAHRMKINYYQKEDITNFVRDATGHAPDYSSITIN